ncbi:MAG: carboxypeptidase regulatory-like domain-containing protein [Planctomycetota bacterium]
MTRQGMKIPVAMVVFVVVVSSGATVHALNYADFPANLQTILDQRIAELNASGGICVAGRVTKSDGVPIHSGADVQVNLSFGPDIPTRIYDGGWFIMNRTSSGSYAGPSRRIIVRAFSYDPLDAFVTILSGEMTFVELTIDRTPPEELSAVVGTVTDENADPLSGATVNLTFPFAKLGYENGVYSDPRMEMMTGTDGLFEFDGLSGTEYSLVASKTGYAYDSRLFTPPAGGTVPRDLRLYPNRRIHLRYAFQANGTFDLGAGDLQTGFLTWLNGPAGVDFSEGRIEDLGYDHGDARDLEMVQTQDVLEFRVFFANGQNGFYDAGAVDFDSVTTAAAGGYSTSAKPVLVGHVYVVRTYDNKYAKFVVETDESSFRTVVPGDSDPIVFAGYGLTVDFAYTSSYGQITVDTQIPSPAWTWYDGLPSYWQVSGMSGVSFVAAFQFTYCETDLIHRRIPEAGLAVLRSTDGGSTWQELNSSHNPLDNTLTVEGLTSLGWFAIVNTSDFIRGDIDGDGDIDLSDFAMFQRCYTGDASATPHVECVLSLFDADADIDGVDFAAFLPCMGGPDAAFGPSCGP